MRRLLPLLLPVLLLAACATAPGKRHPGRPAAIEAAYTLPAQPVIGRIVALDTQRRSVVVALNDEGARILRAEGWTLYARRDDLTVTARLTGTPQRFGSSLGAMIEEGLPALGDEVVLAPTAEAPEPAAR